MFWCGGTSYWFDGNSRAHRYDLWTASSRGESDASARMRVWACASSVCLQRAVVKTADLPKVRETLLAAAAHDALKADPSETPQQLNALDWITDDLRTSPRRELCVSQPATTNVGESYVGKIARRSLTSAVDSSGCRRRPSGCT